MKTPFPGFPGRGFLVNFVRDYFFGGSEFLSGFISPLKALNSSIGNGKTIVVAFSEAISVKVCK